MKPEQIEAEQIVERYLRNELSATETKQFEQRLLWDAEVQEQLALTQRLREGMCDLVADASRPATGAWSGFLHSPRYAAAASILLAVTTFGWLTTWLVAVPGLDDTPGEVASARVFSLETLRGAPSPEDVPLVTPGTATEWLTLLVYPDLEVHPQFRIELARRSDEQWLPIWQGPPTPSGSGDTIAVTLRSALLEPGVHRLRVSGWEDSGATNIASEVFFRVAAN